MTADNLLDHRLLTHDQEIELGRRIQSGDADALDELVRHNLRLVYQIARRYGTADPGTTFDDLVQEGMLGLFTAARRYDPDRGTRFSTYATWWVRQAIQRAAVTAGTIRRSANPDHKLARPSSIRAHALRQSPIIRLDAPLRDRHSDDSDSTLADLLTDGSPSVEDLAFSNIEVERIITALRLNERGQAIVRTWLSGIPRDEAQRMHGVSRSWLFTTLHKRNQEEIMGRPKSTPTACLVPGCTEPLYVSKNGTVLPRCHEHQKQFWRENAAAQRHHNSALPQAKRQHVPSTRISPATSPAVPTAEAAALHENGNGIHAQVQALPPLTAELCSPDGCDGQCVYRQAVEILAARVPGTNELVDALKLLNKAR